MIDVFIKEIRSILEQAVPLWNGGLTKVQISTIERVQKTALFVILDKHYTSYEAACSLANLEPLHIRRETLCLKFARKNLKSNNCLFSKLNMKIDTRRKSQLVKEYKCNTLRYQNSSLPYLARMLNNSQK